MIQSERKQIETACFEAELKVLDALMVRMQKRIADLKYAIDENNEFCRWEQEAWGKIQEGSVFEDCIFANASRAIIDTRTGEAP